MNWTKTNQILQTTANFGIILGLVLVGVQIRDTNRIASAEFLAQSYDHQITGQDILIGDYLSTSWAKAATIPSELTDTDLVIIQAYLQRQWYLTMRDRGVASLSNDSSAFGGAAVVWEARILTNEIALRWWTDHQDRILGVYPEMRDAINARLANSNGGGRSLVDEIHTLRTGPLYPPSVSDQF